MQYYIISILWAICSGAIAYCSVSAVNSRAEEENRYTKVNIIVLAAAIIGGLAGAFTYKNTVSLFACMQLGSTFIAVLVAAIYDYKLKIIPNILPAVLIVERCILFVAEYIIMENAFSYLISSILGCLFVIFVLGVASRISRGGIGMGDIKLLAGIGFMCGLYTVLFTMVFALLVCGVFTVGALGLKKKTMKDSVPFGPFILAGYILVLFLSFY